MPISFSNELQNKVNRQFTLHSFHHVITQYMRCCDDTWCRCSCTTPPGRGACSRLYNGLPKRFPRGWTQHTGYRLDALQVETNTVSQHQWPSDSLNPTDRDVFSYQAHAHHCLRRQTPAGPALWGESWRRLRVCWLGCWILRIASGLRGTLSQGTPTGSTQQNSVHLYPFNKGLHIHFKVIIVFHMNATQIPGQIGHPPLHGSSKPWWQRPPPHYP